LIYDFKYRKLTPKEKADIKANCLLIDQLLTRCPKKCGNPECQYPLPSIDNFAVPEFGEVCELCYRMFHAVYNLAHFIKLHREWKTGHPDRNGNTEPY
jgi:hypothetical protein